MMRRMVCNNGYLAALKRMALAFLASASFDQG